jgi:AbrB family looped-hinge helix DNA binding protein
MEFTATISSKNQVTIPADVRRRLGVGASDKVVFVVEDDGVRCQPAKVKFSDLFGSIPPLPGRSTDFEAEINAAMEEEAERIVRELDQP